MFYISFQLEHTSDPIIINAMMYICKILHDSFKWVECVLILISSIMLYHTSSLSLEDERRQIATSIIGFLCKVFVVIIITINFTVHANSKYKINYIQYIVYWRHTSILVTIGYRLILVKILSNNSVSMLKSEQLSVT